jgi:hypothetical protein
MMWRVVTVAVLLLASGCSAPESLDQATAERILRESSFEVEPVYAEVPQVVRWSERSPRDDYDERSLRTLENLERAGLVTIESTLTPEGETRVQARTTSEGFAILGTVPSARGPAFRARIAEKRVDGIRNFVRHPSEPTVGRAEILWHYENPTRWYDAFETKIDKPIGEPFVTPVSIHWEEGAWRFRILARKVPAGG